MKLLSMFSITLFTLSLYLSTSSYGKSLSEVEELNSMVQNYCATENSCVPTECEEKYKSFIGTWTGPFEAYDQKLADFRPYQNKVTYSTAECLKNLTTGENFIIGRKTDYYPAFKGLEAKTSYGLMMTGRRADGSPFLRTLDSEGQNDYQLVYQNNPAELSIWSLTIAAAGNQPVMNFTVIDGRDLTLLNAHKRNVTVSLEIGEAEQPDSFSTIIARGSHTRQ